MAPHIHSSIEEYEEEVAAEFGFGAHDPIKNLQDEFNRGLIVPDPFDIANSRYTNLNNLFDNNEPTIANIDYWYNDNIDTNEDGDKPQRKKRAQNAYAYKFGDVFIANWYLKFLHPNVRSMTYHLSTRDRYGTFRCLFRVPLSKVDELVQLFLSRGWIRKTQHCKDDDRLRVKAQLLIMATLNIIGHHTPVRTLTTNTEISTSEHRSFLHLFLDNMYSIKDEYIFYPRTPNELHDVMEKYRGVHLPGCGGSIDVVHLKWSTCPAGDRNRCIGKEGYPTLAFEVITGYDREIFGVSSIQFGTRNDQHIVKIDANVNKIKNDWYKTVEWEYYDQFGNRHKAVGVYLICDGGYLRWPILICPYKGEGVATMKGYFSANLESVRKDVECVFGILKKRWKILEYGIRFRDIKVVEKVFVVCCMLHNMMLQEMETRETTFRVGRGSPLPGDAISLAVLNRPVPVGGEGRHKLATEWGKRRKALAAHLQYSKRVLKRRRVSPA